MLEIYVDLESGALRWEGNHLASLREFELADRCVGSIFEVLKPGEVISLAEGKFILDRDLDLIDCPFSLLLRESWIEKVGSEEELQNALGDGNFPCANDYISALVDPATYDRWYTVNGWNIDQMKILEAEGICIESTGATDSGFGSYTNTIAYKFCNYDLNLEDLKTLIEKESLD